MVKESKIKFDLTIYQREQNIFSSSFNVSASTKLSTVSNLVIKDIEKVVVDNGWMTTFAGVFGILINTKTGEVAAMITYKPTFNYNKIFGAHDIYNEMKLLAPGLKL